MRGATPISREDQLRKESVKSFERLIERLVEMEDHATALRRCMSEVLELDRRLVSLADHGSATYPAGRMAEELHVFMQGVLSAALPAHYESTVFELLTPRYRNRLENLKGESA